MTGLTAYLRATHQHELAAHYEAVRYLEQCEARDRGHLHAKRDVRRERLARSHEYDARQAVAMLRPLDAPGEAP